MQTVWTWKFFDALVTDENGVTDALKEVNYVLTGTRGSVAYEIGGRTQIGPANSASFVSFSSLTKEDLVSFVSGSVDVNALKAQIETWHNAKLKKLSFEKDFNALNEKTNFQTDISNADALRQRIAQLEELVRQLTPAPEPDPSMPPPEVMAEAQPDEGLVELKARLLAEFASLRNMLVGHIPMNEEQLLRLQALEHPKFQTWLQG